MRDPTDYVRERLGRARVLRHTSVEQAWVADIWRGAGVVDGDRVSDVPMPGGRGAAIVKRDVSRASHRWNRRLRRARSTHEAEGYLAFCRAGVETPMLLFAAEERRRLVFVRGVVVTERIAAPTVTEAWREGSGPDLLLATAARLAAIHQTGLAHGDPRTRNFLATASGPLPFDLASWGRATRAHRREDLRRFLGSVLLLAEDDALAGRVLEQYEQTAGDLPETRTALLDAARAWSRTKDRP